MTTPERKDYFDYAELAGATANGKQAMLETLVNGFLNLEKKAGVTAYKLGNHFLEKNGQEEKPQAHDTNTAHGSFPAEESLFFMHSAKRLRGFMGAIRRWDEQAAVTDVGCGTFPALSLAAAALHPKAEVQAVEINPIAASVASEVIKLFGLDDRVHVVNEDVARHKIDPNTTAAVTETFNAGLVYEPGPQIVRLLHAAKVPMITPSKAELRMHIGSSVFSTSVDLRNDASACFVVESTEAMSAERPPITEVGAAFYDDKGVVLDFDEDTISRPLTILNSEETHAISHVPGLRSTISYRLGTYRLQPRVVVVKDSME